MVGAVDARVIGVVEPGRIEAQQYVDLVAGPFLGLINLVVLHEGFRKVADSGKVRSLVDDGRIEGAPGMLIEPAANHFAIFRPLVIGIECGMDADEAFTVFLDERQDVLLLTVVEIELTGGAGKDNEIEIVQGLGVALNVFLGEQFCVGAQFRIPEAAFLAEVVNSDHGGCDRVVLVALGLTDDEDMLQMNGLGMRRGWRHRCGRLGQGVQTTCQEECGDYGEGQGQMCFQKAQMFSSLLVHAALKTF